MANLVGCYRLIDDTKAEEAEEIYITKVSLSLGRSKSHRSLCLDHILTTLFILAIVRPEKETALSIEDRAPSAFVADLLRYYTDVFPPVIASRQQEAERIPLQRKATRPIDRRVSRSNSSWFLYPFLLGLIAHIKTVRETCSDRGRTRRASSPDHSRSETNHQRSIVPKATSSDVRPAYPCTSEK